MLEHPVLIVGAGPTGLVLAIEVARRGRRALPAAQAYVVTRSAPTDEDDSDELLYDPTGALHERLGAEQPCLCLERPDGYPGFRGEPPSLESLHAHLRRIFRSG